MLFNTVEYAFFFGVCFLVSWALARHLRGWARLVFLLVASYAFYARWDIRYLPLIFGSSSLDYFLARLIARREGAAKKRLLAITIVGNLLLLFAFKYWNFTIDSIDALARLGGGAGLGEKLTMTLPPVGVSFFTFVSMSYVIEVYRGKQAPESSYFRYLLFVAFFPHLVAGPIVRARDLLPQLARAPSLSSALSGEALFLIVVGLLKKVVIADQLAVNLVDRVFSAPDNHSALEVLAGIYGYAVQIYGDFSGYSDIAIGSALLLGVRFPANFDAPYTASSLSEFWRRWHISLSTWLRDYLYIPLGGNRKGPLRTYCNLLLTMLLGGLWHGAGWTFVFWGLLHGVGLAVARMFGGDDGVERPRGLVRRAVGTFLTFHWVCLAWVFFRAPDFKTAWNVLRRLGTFTTSLDAVPPILLVLLAIGLGSHFVPKWSFEKLRAAFTALPAVAQGALLFGVAVLLHEAASAEAVPFIYFQF